LFEIFGLAAWNQWFFDSASLGKNGTGNCLFLECVETSNLLATNKIKYPSSTHTCFLNERDKRPFDILIFH
jgi:hypothetical protein